MKVFFNVTDRAWADFNLFLIKQINVHKLKTILDIGGGANPQLTIEQISEHGLEYTVSDIEDYELKKIPAGYKTLVWDAAEPVCSIQGAYDLIFSRTVAEHIARPDLFYKNIFSLLRSGGISIHFFPTLFAPPFVCNLLLPEVVSSWVVNLLQKGRDHEGHHRKFKAYYRWCRGPTPSSVARFESVGFKVLEYYGYFGFRGYLQRIPLLPQMHDWLVNYLLRHPNPWLTSFATVVLQKP